MKIALYEEKIKQNFVNTLEKGTEIKKGNKSQSSNTSALLDIKNGAEQWSKSIIWDLKILSWAGEGNWTLCLLLGKEAFYR